LNKKAVILIVGVFLVAIISGVILFNLLFNQSNLEEYGLTGIFIVTLLSHATMLARDIFIPLFLALSQIYNPIILGASAGLGGAIGDLVPYLFGLGVSETVKEKTRTTDTITKWINKYGLWAILAVSMTPLPDMPIIMLAGSRRLPFHKLLVIEALGKTILYSVGAFFGGFIFDFLIGIFGNLITQVSVTIISIIFCIVLTWPPTRDYFFGLFEKILFREKK